MRSSSSTSSSLLVIFRFTRTCSTRAEAGSSCRGRQRQARQLCPARRTGTRRHGRACARGSRPVRAEAAGCQAPGIVGVGQATHQQRRLPSIQPRERVKLGHGIGEGIHVAFIQRVCQRLHKQSRAACLGACFMVRQHCSGQNALGARREHLHPPTGTPEALLAAVLRQTVARGRPPQHHEWSA